MQLRHLIRSLILLPAFLFVFTSQGNALAASGTSAQGVAPAINVTGTWNFTTTDPGFEHFTLIFKQVGHKLRGHDSGGERITGRVFGWKISFTVHGVSSEDDYGGNGMISRDGLTMQGTFWDGFGGTGQFTAQKV
jgi:hypothetical protein